ncbi:MAG: cell division suppressor protein YneA [Bacillota bacterium]
MIKYKIINRFRFFTFLVIISIAISVILFTVIADAKEYNSHDTIQVTVERGDTLWGLAEKYAADNMDLRDYINDVIQINELKTANIMPGQVIILPQ